MSRISFDHIPQAAADPILGLSEAFLRDNRSLKANLGIGIYQDDTGKVPLLPSVAQAEQALVKKQLAKPYLPITGYEPFNEQMQQLLFGADHLVRREKRVMTMQTVAGSGALRVGGDFLAFAFPGATIHLSDPSWENHRAIFEQSGLKTATYPYFDQATRQLRFTDMIATFEALPSGSLVLLHACCHNPTGVDPTKEQWDAIASVIARRGLFPFVDCAYQGFGESLSEDAYAIKAIAATGVSMIVAASCSKNFGLYRDRIGSLSFVAPDEATLTRVTSQLKRIVRSNYSSPPAQGALIVTEILTNPALRTQWETELTEMRDRIKTQRKVLTETLNAADLGQDFSFILAHRGMFTYTGFSEAVVDTLRTEHGVYLVRSGRMCIAALNSANRNLVAEAIIKTLRA